MKNSDTRRTQGGQACPQFLSNVKSKNNTLDFGHTHALQKQQSMQMWKEANLLSLPWVSVSCILVNERAFVEITLTP